ncbi:YozE SAM-like protein [Sphingomonas sp. PP-CE-1A-559]|uniref:YozE family protein n=1 Tax=Sphingomonas sp. PP-CE-1A-559 TaxID=2135657 RepID=UPI001056941B|nr:YozE family protein [Sphingomonas sp. PP-CE-1A-559]TCP87569.1 YozE SAM-like protein [Sphingomonas sp. PP-CE-1A-559]
MTDDDEPKAAFGQWLMAQKDRSELVGQLAAGAVVDRRFPRTGDPDAVRKHLSAMQAEGDMFAAVDDAESDWLSA